MSPKCAVDNDDDDDDAGNGEKMTNHHKFHHQFFSLSLSISHLFFRPDHWIKNEDKNKQKWLENIKINQ